MNGLSVSFPTRWKVGGTEVGPGVEGVVEVVDGLGFREGFVTVVVMVLGDEWVDDEMMDSKLKSQRIGINILKLSDRLIRTRW